MKILVVFYSRTGNTRKAAEEIAKALDCETEEIIDTRKRAGFIRYLSSSRDAMKERLTEIEAPKKNPSDYDLVAIGTPVWVSKMSVPVRTYISLKKSTFKKVAFFCTAGEKDNSAMFAGMSEACGKAPVATLGILEKELKKNEYHEKIQEFARKLKE